MIDTPIYDATFTTFGNRGFAFEHVKASAGDVLSVLRKTRALVVGGYAPGLSSRAEGPNVRADSVPETERCYSLEGGVLRVFAGGRWSWPSDEAIRFVTLADALHIASAGNANAELIAEEQISLQLAPRLLGNMSVVTQHLESLAPVQQLPELVKYLDRAIMRVLGIVKRR